MALTKYKRCNGEGHQSSDAICPARITDEMAEMTELFHGQDSVLSNLHHCEDGYEIKDYGTSFPTSEHHYQFKKLKAHDKGEEAWLLLSKELGFQAMKAAQQILPEPDVSETWKQSAWDEILETCYLKFTSCTHAHEYLLQSRITLAEATRDNFWGTGLNLQQSSECLPDFWPGDNIMGKILMEIRAELKASEEKKQKASSPLECEQAKMVKS